MCSNDVQTQSHVFRLRADHSQQILQTLKSKVKSELTGIKNSCKNTFLSKAFFSNCSYPVGKGKILFKKLIRANMAGLKLQARDILNDIKSSLLGMKFEMNP